MTTPPRLLCQTKGASDMAQTETIQGTAEELIAFLEKCRHRTNLTLLVPPETAEDALLSSYPEGAVIRNGVPLFPTTGSTEPMTMEQIRQLLEEE